MKALIGLTIVAAAWFSTAAGVMTMVGNVHRWWGFVPAMDYSTAVGVTFPMVVFGAVVGGVLGAVWDKIKEL